MQAEAVITGVCETDFSGYPDCRDEFVRALNHAVNLVLAKNIRFETLLMWLDKAQTWALADYYEHLETIREQRLTCITVSKAMVVASVLHATYVAKA